eukprot:3676580-Rhodomonas_salina.2
MVDGDGGSLAAAAPDVGDAERAVEDAQGADTAEVGHKVPLEEEHPRKLHAEERGSAEDQGGVAAGVQPAPRQAKQHRRREPDRDQDFARVALRADRAEEDQHRVGARQEHQRR